MKFNVKICPVCGQVWEKVLLRSSHTLLPSLRSGCVLKMTDTQRRIKESRGERLYRCGSKVANPTVENCGLRSVNIDKLNSLVWEILCKGFEEAKFFGRQLDKLFSDDPQKQATIKKEIVGIERRLIEKDKEKDRIIRLYGKDGLSEKDVERSIAEVNRERHEIEGRIQSLKTQLSAIKEIKRTIQWWEERREYVSRIEDDLEKQQIVKMFVEGIVVNYDEVKKDHLIKINLKYPIHESVGYKEVPKISGIKSLNGYIDELPHMVSGWGR